MGDDDHLAAALSEAYLRMCRLLDRRMAAKGVSLAKTKVLMLIEHEGPLSAAEIAKMQGMSLASVAEAVELMERQGLVRRKVNPDDARAKLVSLTDAGAAGIAASEPIRSALISRMFLEVTEPDRRSFERVLSEIMRAIREEEA